MKSATFLFMLLVFSVPIFGQEKEPFTQTEIKADKSAAPKEAPASASSNKTIDVPEIAEKEIGRRGNMVQEIGTIKASETDVIADALAPPADDSDKWFVCVVTMDACKPCEHLKHDFETNPILKSWVDVKDPAKSPCHYQIRRIEDETQKDWLAGIKDQIGKDVNGFPVVVIQPPRNGQYGPNYAVVKLIHGYDGNAEKLTQKMRDGITTYVQSLNKKGLINKIGSNTARGGEVSAIKLSGGLQQSEPIGANPPFTTPLNPYNVNGSDFPPPAASGLTLEQMKALLPDAPADFLLQAVTQRIADPQALATAYAAWKLQHNNGGLNLPSLPNGIGGFITLAMQLISMLLSGGFTIGTIAALLVLWRKANKNHILSESNFNYLVAILNRLDPNAPAALETPTKKPIEPPPATA